MFKAIKELGQNFLRDRDVVQKMVRELDISTNDVVIEIGPGLGALTHEIGRNLKGSNLIAVEKDKRFIHKLEEDLKKYPNIEIIHEDIMNFLPKFESDKDIKIIGSLPYYITSPIIHSVIKMKKQPSIVIILIQKEVAEKILAEKEKSNYLSTFVSTFYSVESLGIVTKDKFDPEPRVDGEVLKLTKKESQIPSNEIERYEEFLHRGFKFPRKMLNKSFSKELLEENNISSDVRPHDLNVSDWINLFNLTP